MNIRQQKYKKNRLLGMNPENAAIAAGYARSTARAKAYRIERSAKVGLEDAFEQAGLTDKAIVQFALKGLYAMKLRACDVYVKKDENGKWVINENSNDFIEVEDWTNRHKFFETILDLLNKKSKVPLIDQSTHTHYHFLNEALKKANERANESQRI